MTFASLLAVVALGYVIGRLFELALTYIVLNLIEIVTRPRARPAKPDPGFPVTCKACNGTGLIEGGNQCDGCKRGLMREVGMHVDNRVTGEPFYQACTRLNYYCPKCGGTGLANLK